MRLIKTFTLGNRIAKVYRLSDTNEYVCRLGNATGKPGNNAGDYFTDDWADAMDTALAMLGEPLSWNDIEK